MQVCAGGGVGAGILPSGQGANTALHLFLFSHIFQFSFQPRFLNPCAVESFGKLRVGVAPTRVELNPPGSRAGLPPLLLLLAAPSSVQAASSSCRELPNTPGELQLRAATKSVRDFTPRRLSVEEVLLSPSLFFLVPSVLLSLVERPDIRVSFCTGLRFPYKAGGLGGGGSPRWESSAAGGSTEPFPGLSGQ